MCVRSPPSSAWEMVRMRMTRKEEEEDAYEAVAVNRVVMMVVVVMMLCGLEERSPRHPRTHIGSTRDDAQGSPPPMRNPHERTSAL